MYTIMTPITLRIELRPRELNFPESAGVRGTGLKHKLICFKLLHYKDINRHGLSKFQKSCKSEHLQRNGLIQKFTNSMNS